MIIHSPIISGSLTFADGSTFTLPDGGNYSGSFSGSVQISEVQSHLIPNTNEEYDLGSATNRFRDIYLSNNTMKMPSGSFGFGDNGFGFNDPFGNPAPIAAGEIKVLDPVDGSFAKLSVEGGVLTTKAFDPFGDESAFDMASQLSGSFTGSFLGEMLATNGVVSGSSQITIGSVTGFTAYSESVDERISTEKGRVDAILLSSDADKDSFAEIVTLINSVDTTNDSVFGGFVTSSNQRLDSIEGFTSSIDTTIKTKMDADSVVSGSSQLVSLLPSGVVSSSAQVNADSITNFDSNVKSKLDVDGVISSSVQVDVLQTTNFTEFSASVAETFGGLSTDYNDLQNIPSGIISSSEQLAADFLDTLGDNVVSSSAQVDLTQTTNYASGIKLKLDAESVFSSSAQVDITGTNGYSTVSSHIASTSNPHSVTATQVGLGNVDNTSDANKPVSTATQTALNTKLNVNGDGVVSGSSQVTLGDVTGFNTFSSSVSDTFDGLSSNYEDLVGIPGGIVSGSSQVSYPALSNIPSGIVSGSSQIDVTATTNYSTVSSHISSTSNPHSVTATQVGLGSVTNESKATMFTSPTFTGTVSGVTATHVGLGSVTNESKATMFTSPTLTGTTTVGSISFGDATIATASGTLAITATSGISLLTSGGGDGVTIAANGNTTIYGALALESIPAAASATSALVNNSGVVSQRTLGSNAFTSDSYVTTTSAQSLSSAANALTFAGNVLTLTRGDGSTDTINLSAYLDDTNLARVISGTYDSDNQELVFTRDDASTFTIDASMFFDDTNLVTSVNAGSGISVNSTTGGVTVTNSAPNVTTNLSTTANGTSLTINSSDGTNASIPAATTSAWGAMTDEDKSKLNGIAAGANLITNNNQLSNGAGYITGISSANVTTALGFTPYNATNPAGYTTYTSNQATNTNSNVTFGTVSATGDVVAYASSDKRLKDNIVNIENPIEKVQKLNGVTWDWNSNADELQQSLPNVGVIAQEVEEVFPQLVHDRENGYKGVDYAKLTGLLIEAVKEQQKQIDELKSRLG